MKITGIISSPKREGNSATLVREALKAAQAAGAEVQEIFLPDYNIGYCQGCSVCVKDGKCPIKDDYEKVKAMLLESDGIIASSPTYCASYTAILKTLMDRLGMMTKLTSPFAGKYVAAISTCSTMGAKKTAKTLAMLFTAGTFKRGYISGELAVTLRGGIASRDDADAMEKARKLGTRIVHDIRTGRKYALQGLGGRLINAIMRKQFAGIIVKMKDTTLKGAYEDLVARGLLKAVNS